MLHADRPRAWTLLVLGALAATPDTATAQRIIYSTFDGANPATSFLDLDTGRTTPVASDLTGSAVFSADGAFVIRTVTVGQVLESRVRHVPSGVEATLGVAFVPQVAHPRALAVFGTVDGVLTRLDPSGITSWTPCGAGVNAAFQLSSDGARLFSVCPDGRFLVIDSASGGVVRDTIIGTVSSFVASPDGSEIVVVRTAIGGPELARLDALSGQTLTARPLFTHPFSLAPGPLYSVPGGTRVIQSELILGAPGNTGYDLRLVEFDSLTTLPGLAAPRSVFPQAPLIAEDGLEAYVGSTSTAGGVSFSTVRRFDLESGALLASAGAPSLVVAGVASVPLAPRSLVAQVVGGAVSLTWALAVPSAAATGYRLAIGSSAGASDLGSIALGPGESFSATGVPPGRYFVRLHTVNSTGESPASADVVIAVP